MPIQTFTGLDPNDEKGEVIVTGTIYQSVKRFEELGLSEALLKGCYDMKFTRPSKIQGQALPVIMSAAHTNLIGQAHHGSGKTATYSLGMLSRVDETKMHPQCICVTPTRELARQVFDVVNGLAKFTKIKSFLAVPGGKREKVTAQVVIGTPGTLLNKFDKKNIDPRGIVQFVADEADVMISKQGLGEQTLRLRKYVW